MPIDLAKLKGATLDDKAHAELTAAFDELTQRVDTAEEKARKAVRESIDGRKAKDARIERLSELLGIEPDADLEKIDVKGMADAQKQVEAQLKRAIRERDEKAAALDELTNRNRAEKMARAIAEAASKLPFVDPEDARVLLSSRAKYEGEDVLFFGPDGKSCSLDDGAAWIAKTKPHLLRASDAGGSGSGFKGGGGGGGKAGDLGGDKSARVAAISQRFPELAAKA